ncbi:MAG: hypothetical protein V1690_01270 [Candidatus Moraniibacteriota bacterium]
MGKTQKKRAGRAGIVLGLVLSLVLTTAVFAATKPKISTIEHKTSTTVKLPITYKTYKNKKVKVKVKITNKTTDKTTTVTKSGELDYLGKDTIEVTGLTAGTEYSFKVKIRKTSSKNSKYSSWSNSKTTETEASSDSDKG